jgi:hypothetical protein
MFKKPTGPKFVDDGDPAGPNQAGNGQSYCIVKDNPSRCLIYIHIPKNASSWTKHHTPGYLFNYRTQKFYEDIPSQYNIDVSTWSEHLQNVQYVVILREPINRWVTGLAQYLQGWDPAHPLHINNVDWDSIFDTVVFDSHTQPQCDFIKGIDHSKTTWLRCDDTLANNFGKMMEQFTGTPFNLTTEDQDPTNVFNITKKINPTVTELFTTELQQNIVNRINEKLSSNPDYLNRLRSFYKEDFELFETVNFYQA